MEKNKRIIQMRLAGFTLSDVAEMFGLTRLEVRKLESTWINDQVNVIELGEKMYDEILDESLFNEVFDTDPVCNCECGCFVPVSGQCVDCSENNGHQNNNGLPKYDQLNEATNNYLKERE